ncbi:DinB family protein [Alicyclobacillus dauci]|uniref:DinB family protein n=1 Tax=Alicyclobacillus dauci TaxID=1475485 RepID=A0ABY6YYC6_9BACL|nr:DinB family protein [Alicyclobacillus dauci]WAH35633.1 DinB family protein [Alicyclobacillus dauci]
MSKVSQTSEVVVGLHRDLADTVSGLDTEALHWKADESTWSVAQILAHVAEFEHFFSEDILHLKANPGTAFGRTMENVDRIRAVDLDGSESLEELLQRIDVSQHETLDMLSTLSDDDLLIHGSHPKIGERTIEWEIGHFITDHLEKHIGQIRRTLEAYHSQEIHLN